MLSLFEWIQVSTGFLETATTFAAYNILYRAIEEWVASKVDWAVAHLCPWASPIRTFSKLASSQPEMHYSAITSLPSLSWLSTTSSTPCRRITPTTLLLERKTSLSSPQRPRKQGWSLSYLWDLTNQRQPVSGRSSLKTIRIYLRLSSSAAQPNCPRRKWMFACL